jgi:hypothetical protein
MPLSKDKYPSNPISMNTDCEVCQHVLQVLVTPSATYDFCDLSLTLGAILELDCPHHQELFQILKDEILEEAEVELVDGKTGFPVITRKAEETYAELSCRAYYDPDYPDDFEHSLITINILLILKEDNPGHNGCGRILNPDWVDLSLVQGWQQRCISEHGLKCSNPWKIKPARPAWMIDAHNNCILPGNIVPMDSNYIAMSYRWNNANGFKVDVNLLPTLLQPNSLERPEISSRLPPIIRDAIQLTRNVGERYIWIDDLCIVHGGDDPNSTKHQLDLMGAIYASASMTIVATDGDAEYGLPGVNGSAESRNLHQQIIPFGSNDETIVVRRSKDFGLETEYHQRAWTYQEYELASRKLIFAENEIHWLCQGARWHEDTTIETSREMQPLGFEGTVPGCGFPDLEQYYSLVNDYNVRELTYDDDALSAISGMLAIYSRCFEGGFLFGLPEMFFDIALSWRSPVSLRRRRHSLRTGSASSVLPSWSWIGWHGWTQVCVFEEGFFGLYESSPTHPITTWYASDTPNGTNKRRVKSSWFEKRKLLKDFTQPMPSGWTRHPIVDMEEERMYDFTKSEAVPGPKGYFFAHEHFPHKRFLFPIPVTDITIATITTTPEQMPYILCQTKRAFLHRICEGLVHYRLTDALGRDVGTISLQEMDDVKPIGIPPNWSTLIEVVAISRRGELGDPIDSQQYVVLEIE